VPDVKPAKIPHPSSRTGLHSRLTPLRNPASGSGLVPQACGVRLLWPGPPAEKLRLR
jgi:hypothetical protein